MDAAARLREAPPRTWLFVPALRAPEWIPKAIAAGADAIIVDLEDATAPAEKARAREVVRALDLSSERPLIAVRVNASPEGALAEDLNAAAAARASAVILPKASRVEDIRRAAKLAPGMAIVAMTETARGIVRALELAEADDHVLGLAFGGEDLAADMGLSRTGEVGELGMQRTLVALAAAAAGIAAIDGPWMNVSDVEGARADAAFARSVGFSGKMCIHPSHVAPVNEAFTPTDEEVARARGIVEALDAAIASGSGVAVHERRMIDAPSAAAARRILARAKAAGRTT